MRLIPPITPAEFFYHLQRCIPPGGWRPRIAVANSGGPDSTALLFLLTAIKHLPGHAPFSTVFSVHVNHGLQAAASAMEQTATSMAKRFKARSIVQTIPWGTANFPERPEEDSPGGERLIREARYNMLFAAMQEARTNVMAFAHHADDQVETTIMRMSRGSSDRGLAGMWSVRRWGMGHKDHTLYQFGPEGMQNWIVRPFLQIPKDRLLATCEANKLDYVNDPTNFQPGITIRNAIRHLLSSDQHESTELLASSQGQTLDIAPYVAKLRAMVPNSPPSEQLREAVRLYSVRLEEVEAQVTNILAKARLPSAPSTLLLKTPGLALATNPEVRTALIRRSLRYVSHAPWGSLPAEAHGEREAFQRIAHELWPPTSEPRSTGEGEGAPTPRRERSTFTAGAGVVVMPVCINPKRSNAVRHRAAQDNELEGWILARAPHYHREGDRPGVVDVTAEIMQAGQSGKKTWTVLYDQRFTITFVLEKLPRVIENEVVRRGARILIEPDTKWALPMVTLVGKKTTQRCIGKYLWYVRGWQNTCQRLDGFQRWIIMDFLRSLDEI